MLGVAPELEPILLGGIFRLRGSGSWARTDARAEGMAEIERRAASYGLPPMAWPDGWPGDGLTAMRAATWAKQLGAVDEFTRVAFAHAFVAGEDITGVDALVAIAGEAGLPAEELRSAIASDAVKGALRAATDAAWARGVRGVPTLERDGELFYGDDRLEQAGG